MVAFLENNLWPWVICKTKKIYEKHVVMEPETNYFPNTTMGQWLKTHRILFINNPTPSILDKNVHENFEQNPWKVVTLSIESEVRNDERTDWGTNVQTDGYRMVYHNTC